MLLTHVIHSKHAQYGIHNAVIRLPYTSCASCMWCDPFTNITYLWYNVYRSSSLNQSNFVTLNWKCIFDVHFLSRYSMHMIYPLTDKPYNKVTQIRHTSQVTGDWRDSGQWRTSHMRCILIDPIILHVSKIWLVVPAVEMQRPGFLITSLRVRTHSGSMFHY